MMETQNIINNKTETGSANILFATNFKDFIDKVRPWAESLIHSLGVKRHEDAEDVFQNSCLALYDNIRQGRYHPMDASLEAYFYSICRRQSFKYQRGIRHWEDIQSGPFDIAAVDELAEMDENQEHTFMQRLLRCVVLQLPPPCQQLLWGFYAYQMSMKEIADMLNYKNAATAKTKKSQCISKLKQFINQKRKNISHG